MNLTEAVSRRMGDPPTVIGIAGAVAVGKSTLARGLAADLGAAILSTDGFLFPNTVLDGRGLGMRKGFPETFDLGALAACLDSFRQGEGVDVPVYSHDVYDIVPDVTDRLEPSDVLILEGVVALQEAVPIDIGVYIEAPSEVVRRWFIDRLTGMIAEAGPGSFYAGFTNLDDPGRIAFAENVWDSINGPNLTDHIAPTAERAHIIVQKGSDHTIERIEERRR